MRALLLLTIPLCLLSCRQKPAEPSEQPLARVFDNYLYPADLKGLVVAGITGNDSITVVNDFIEKWIRNKLLLYIAERNLTDHEKDVSHEIENYRSSLLIYAYQQSYLQQNLDTVVSESEIESWYNENQANFILNQPMMTGTFIKLPVNAPEIYKVRQWYRSDNPEHIKLLEAWCFEHATVFTHFNDSWVNVNEVLRTIPSDNQLLLNTLKNRRYLETRDQNYYYFVNANKLAPEGTTTPYELVKDNIHSIILNKRKVQLISELESNIFSDAQNREHFTIYK